MQQRARKAIRLRNEINGVSHQNCSEIVIAFCRGGPLHWPRSLGRRRLSSKLPNSPSASRGTVASTAPTQRNHHGMDWTALRWRAGNRTAPNLGLKYEHSAGPESFDSGDVGDLEWRLIPDTATTIEKSPQARQHANPHTPQNLWPQLCRRAVKTMINSVTCCTN
jgi:hypothetical protein